MALSPISSRSMPQIQPMSYAAPSQGTQSADGSDQKAQMEQLMQMLQQLLKMLGGTDGFDDPSQKSGGGGGGGGGGCGKSGGAGGGGGAHGAGGAGGGGGAHGAGGAGGGGGAQASGGAGGGGGGAQGAGGAGGGGGAQGAGGESPVDLASSGDPSSASPSKGSEKASDVAKEIAQNATHWSYSNTGGEAIKDAMAKEDNFDKTKSGVCSDMAVEAAQEFEAKGIDARVVDGQTGPGLHAWVQYKGDDGQYHTFDPTAAACTKDANQAINTDHNAYQFYGNPLETFDNIPKEI